MPTAPTGPTCGSPKPIIARFRPSRTCVIAWSRPGRHRYHQLAGLRLATAEAWSLTFCNLNRLRGRPTNRPTLRSELFTLECGFNLRRSPPPIRPSDLPPNVSKQPRKPCLRWPCDTSNDDTPMSESTIRVIPAARLVLAERRNKPQLLTRRGNPLELWKRSVSGGPRDRRFGCGSGFVAQPRQM